MIMSSISFDGMSVIAEISEKVTVLSFLGRVNTNSANAMILILSSRVSLLATRAGLFKIGYLGVYLSGELFHIFMELGYTARIEGLHQCKKPAITSIISQRLKYLLFKLT